MKKIIPTLLIIFIFVFASIFIWHFFWNNYSTLELANFGDFYSGTIGILFAIVAAFIAFKTYTQQVKVSQNQNFENTFFKLLEMHEKNVLAMDISYIYNSKKEELIGKRSFAEIFLKLKSHIVTSLSRIHHTQNYTDLSESEKIKKELEIIQEAYIDFSKEFLVPVTPYLRHLYYLISYVDDQSFLTHKKKLVYMNMIRTQLSSYELLFLFYACLSIRGYKKFKPLVERYGILSHIEHIKDKLLSLKVDHLDLFEKGAFDEPSNDKI